MHDWHHCAVRKLQTVVGKLTAALLLHVTVSTKGAWSETPRRTLAFMLIVMLMLNLKLKPKLMTGPSQRLFMSAALVSDNVDGTHNCRYASSSRVGHAAQRGSGGWGEGLRCGT